MENTRTTRSRKRQKVSHADENTEDSSAPPSKSTNKATTAPPDKMEPAQTAPVGKELGVLEEDLESMRHLISCKICQRFLTEPYGLACGHTYCYICLDSWLVTQRKNTCPECRTEVKQQPVPSLIIREMVHIFSTKQELLADGESMADLKKNAEEAASKVASDKANISEGGLFKGMFSGTGRLREAFYDAEDNVHRCPVCGHEIEDGACSGCGLPLEDPTGAWTDHEEAEFDDFEGGYETEDIFPQFSTRIMGENALRSSRSRAQDRSLAVLRRIQLQELQEMFEEDEEGSDISSYDEDEPDLEGFVVPDDEPESRGQEDDSPEVQSRRRLRRGHLPTRSTRSNNASRPIILSDSSSDSDDTSVATVQRPGRRRQPISLLQTDTPSIQQPSESSDSSPVSSNTSSSEEEAPIPRGRQVRKSRHSVLHPPSRTTVSYETSSDSESHSGSETSDESDEDDEDESTDSQLSSDSGSDTNSDSDSDASDSTATATHSGHPFDDEQHNAVLAASLRLHGIQSDSLSRDTSEDDDDY